MGCNKINTVRMLGAKFGRERTIDVEESKRKRVFKSGRKRKRRNLKRRKETLSKRITAEKFETRVGGQRRSRKRIKKDLSRNKVAKTSKGRRSRNGE